MKKLGLCCKPRKQEKIGWVVLRTKMVPTLSLLLTGLSCASGFMQSFLEKPTDVAVIEHESVILRCKIKNLAGNVQWTSDGFAMGYTLDTIRNYCKKCEPVGDTAKGEYHLKVKNVELEQHNSFECQVSPDPENKHSEIRASANIQVLVPPKKISLEPDIVVEMRADFPSKLRCRVWESNPPANILWFIDGQRILDQEIHETQSSGRRNGTYDTENTLTFTPTPAHHNSVITCRVEQKHALLKNRIEERQTKLHVYYPPEGPIIHGYSSSTVYKEGDLINITCQALGGNPSPTVFWFKGVNNTKEDIPFHTQDDGTYSNLELRATSAEHGSTYTCHAWNNITQISLPSIPIYLNISFSTDVVLLEGPDFVELGKSIQLTCSAENSNPPADIFWFIDGDVSRGNTKQEPSGEGGYRTISFKDVFGGRTDDKIEVSCAARAAGREKKASKEIKIKRPPEKPVITGFPRHTVREGDILSLECRSQNGSPLPELEWRKEGSRLPDQNFKRIDGVYTSSKLTLQVTRQDNQVEYSCQASNGVNFVPAVQKENFTVYFPPLNGNLYMARLEGGPEIQVATAGEKVKLHCTSESSNPAPRFHWIKDGVQVLNGVAGDEGPGKNGGKISSFIYQINNGEAVSAEDTGSNYSCVIYNPTISGHQIYKNITLVVRYKPEFGDIPLIYRIREGEDLNLDFQAKAYPEFIEYTWLNQMNFHRRRFDIEGSRLSIRQVERGDAGTYLLFASNNIGKTELAVQIIVEYPARIVAVSSGVEAKEGETVKFLCKVDGNPITNSTVRWIGPQGPGAMLQKLVTFDGNSTFTLTIPSVDKTDRGQYRCIADNGVHNGALPGRDTQLQVHFRPEIRKFSRFSKFSENRMFPTKIPCYAYGYPEVSIFWEKESEMGKLTPQRFSFPADGKAKQVESGTWLSELEINPVENSDFTLYRCSVNNSLGSDSHIIRIVHNSAPDPVSKLEVKQFENKTVRLRWEPGFNGGFDQEFIYRVREVSSDKVIYEGKARHEEMGPHKQFIEQYIILENLGDYAFSIKARNVQGDSAYSVEQFESLKAAEVHGHEENTLPRVVIVAIVLGSILVVIIKLIVITCCIKQRKESRSRQDNQQHRDRDRHSSESSRKSTNMMINYATTFGTDLYLSPPSQNSGSSYSDQDNSKHLGRSYSVPGESEGHTSYTTCSRHGTLPRQISSVLDTTLEDSQDSVFYDVGRSGNLNIPTITAASMLRKGRRSRAGSLSSPSQELPPRLGISGLYTDYMDRRNHSSGGGSVSPTSPIPTPPPPVHVSTLGRWGFPTNGISNGHPPFSNSPPMHIETSRELTRRINELGSNHDLDVPDSMGHLHLDNFNRRLPQPYTQTYHHPARMGSESIGIRSGVSKPYKH